MGDLGSGRQRRPAPFLTARKRREPTMVCYARPLSLLAAIVIVAWLVFAGPVTHFFATAAILVAVLIAAAAAAAAAAFVVTAALSHRRRLAAGGGCVTCRFRCQHAMTGSHPSWLVRTADPG